MVDIKNMGILKFQIPRLFKKNQSMWFIYFFLWNNEYYNLALSDLNRTKCFEISRKYFDVTCFFEVLLVSQSSLLWCKKRGFVGLWQSETMSFSLGSLMCKYLHEDVVTIRTWPTFWHHREIRKMLFGASEKKIEKTLNPQSVCKNRFFFQGNDFSRMQKGIQWLISLSFF